MNKRVLIVRHAERPAIPRGQTGIDLQLTKYGINSTKQFAKTLKGNIISIHSSPVLRCLQTARLIAEITTFDQSKIKQNRLLGNPGIFIKDEKLAWKSWKDKGNNAVNLHLLTGIETWPGFRPFDKAINKIHDQIRVALSNCNSGTIIWITHDTILAPLASRLLENPLLMDDWPNYLGYLDCSINKNEQMTYNYSK